MTILIGSQASPLVENQLDSTIQTQMCGIELTLKNIERFISCGKVAFDNKEREISDTISIYFDETDWIYLEQGAYLITFNEIINIPRDMVAIARPRSTLLRNGVTIETALWDPGYRGRSQSLLVVHNSHGVKIKKNARLMQLIYMKLNSESEQNYSGVYQGENI